MRVALLSLVGRTEDGNGEPVANLCLAGTSIVERQLDLALSLGCERIICLTRPGAELPASLETATISADVKLSTISGPRGLLGLLGANDELLVVADGLVPVNATAAAALEKGRSVLAFPVDAGLAAGFERIDLNYAWAGILLMPASQVERLTQLPSDCDTISSLLRIALQGQVPIRNLPETLIKNGRWALIESGQSLAEFESEWIHRHLTSPGKFAPGRSLAGAILRMLGPRLIGERPRSWSLLVAGSLCALLGVVSAWFGYGVIAIAACGAGWLLTVMGFMLGRVLQSGLLTGNANERVAISLPWLVDLCFLASLALLVPGDLLSQLFPPFVLLALLHIGATGFGDKWGELMRDRLLLAIALAAAIAGGLLLPAMQLLSVVLLLALLHKFSGRSQLTRA